MIKPPQAFVDFVSGIYDGPTGFPPDADAWLRKHADLLRPEQKCEVAKYLDVILASNYADQELQDAWNECGPVWGTRTEDYRAFLTLVRRAFSAP